MAQVAEKDHDIIKHCGTLTHDTDFSEGSSQGLSLSLYQGFLSSLGFGCLGQTRLERLQVSSFKESCGKPWHRCLCSAQELHLIRGSHPHCLSVLCCRRPCAPSHSWAGYNTGNAPVLLRLMASLSRRA